MNCYHCAHEIPTDTKIFRQTVCEQCGSYVHCCMNCQHYDSKAYNQCHEPAADRVLDKEKANFAISSLCEWLPLNRITVRMRREKTRCFV